MTPVHPEQVVQHPFASISPETFQLLLTIGTAFFVIVVLLGTAGRRL